MVEWIIHLLFALLNDPKNIQIFLQLADALKQASDAWWGELKEFGIQASLILDMEQFNKGIGHWTQARKA